MDRTHVLINYPYSNYEIWKENNHNELFQMFEEFDNRFKDVLGINKEVFDLFCQFIFDNSTGK